MEEENLNPSNDETSTETDLNDDVKQCCEPCSTRNIESIALQYCQDCDEKFCDTCTASHQTQKATKGHTIVDIKHVQFNSPKKECEPCSFSNKSTPATCACEDCEEFLCAQCKTFHLSQKQNKNHNVISILDEVLCKPCKSADKRLQASGYCLHCEDPEPLCHSCVEQHTQMKLTRGHELSYDIANFILRYKGKDEMKADPYCSQNQRTCEPSTYRKKSVLAAHYCRECEEFMCDSCISQHRSMHDIANVNNITTSVDMCEPCKYDKKERQATHKCEECDEYLCGECKTVHLSKKMNRNHPLKQLFSSISCDNCSANGCEVMASVYCKDCDSPLCDSCAECHSSMKRTRGHVLSKDLTVVISSLSNKGNTTRPMSATNEDDNYSGARQKTGPFLSESVFTHRVGLYSNSNSRNYVNHILINPLFKEPVKGSILTTGIYCDDFFIDCDVDHSLVGSYSLFKKAATGDTTMRTCMELESTKKFENLVNLSSNLKEDKERVSVLNEKLLLHAVDTSQYLFCRLALSYIDDSETTLSGLSKVLKYAIEKKDYDISLAIVWHLTWVYFTKYKSVLPTLIDIWPAYRCTCTNESESHNDICSSDAVIVVQLDTEEAQSPDMFFSIQVIYFTNVIDLLANKILPCPDDIAISSYSAETLFDNHRNLTLICKSSFLTSQNHHEPSTTKIKLQSCVKLFCKGKGFIPMGEKHFPKTLCGMPTKVIQGTPTLMTGIQIGSKIGTDIFKKGTLGGFVRLRGEDAFLTCLHIFLNAEELTADYITLDDDKSYDVKYYPNTAEASNTDNGFVCGKIQLFGFGKNSEGTSVDAALIQLEKGIHIDSSHFTATTGLQSCYLNDICIDFNSLRHGFPGPTISVVSIGSVSGMSNIEFNVMVQKPVDIDIDSVEKSFSDIILEGMRHHVVDVIEALHSWSDITTPLHDRIVISINKVCGTEMLNETKESIAEIVNRIFPETLKEENCNQKEKIYKLLHEVTMEQTSSKFSAIVSDVHMQRTALTMTVESAKRKSYKVYKQIYIPGIPFQMGDSGKCLYVHDRVNKKTRGCIGMAIATHPNGGCIATPIMEILKYFQIRFKDCS